eukprot:2410103-Pleurochrysis_carterae.AAC.1
MVRMSSSLNRLGALSRVSAGTTCGCGETKRGRIWRQTGRASVRRARERGDRSRYAHAPRRCGRRRAARKGAHAHAHAHPPRERARMRTRVRARTRARTNAQRTCHRSERRAQVAACNASTGATRNASTGATRNA